MPVKDQAAYMREYRAKQKALTWGDVLPDPLALADMVTSELRAENARLTEEVARLKRELAQRPAATEPGPKGSLPYHLPTFGHSSPAPKPVRRK